LSLDLSPRRIIKDRLQRSLSSLNNLSESSEKRVLIFAPHQDDETLGCGGVIRKKIDAGEDVSVVFVTDGSTSHANLIPVSELIHVRKIEAVEACNVLGVSEDHVLFLKFKDGSLYFDRQPVIKSVERLIMKVCPDEIFIPSRFEGTLDHTATNQIILEAIQNIYYSCVVYEYPVWYWFHWPWVSVAKSDRYLFKIWIKNTLKMGFGLTVPQYFNTSLRIYDVLEIKKEALLRHQTQMIKPEGQNDWPILGDIARGDFLDCFFGGYEYFFGYVVPLRKAA